MPGIKPPPGRRGARGPRLRSPLDTARGDPEHVEGSGHRTRPVPRSAASLLADAIAIHREETRDQAERWLDRTAQLEQWLDRYVSLYQDAPIGHVTIDAKGVVIEANAAAAALMGVARERLCGKPLVCFVHVADAPMLLSHLARCADGAASTELRLRGADGTTSPVQLLSKRAWLPGSHGAFHTVIWDISDRRRSEQALRASEKRHREIVETANEGICIVNAENQIAFVNRRLAAMVGGAPDDLIGRSAFDLIPDDDLTEARRLFARRDTGAVGQTEQRLRRLDGSTIWTIVSTSLMWDDGGELAGMLRMFTDNSARHELSETREQFVRQLVAAQEQERQRIARELHDQMGQHIVALSLGLARLAAVTAQVDGASEVIDRLKTVTDLLGRDVHVLARDLRPAALDHLGLCAALASYAEGVAARTGIEMDVHCDDIGDMLLNPDVQTGIYRIAQEALTNITKHAAAHRVSVIVERRPDALHLIVEDDGVGFDPIRRRSVGLSCLGLAGMHERATLIGAALTIESTPARGTTVYLRFPLPVKAVIDHEETTSAAR